MSASGRLRRHRRQQQQPPQLAAPINRPPSYTENKPSPLVEVPPPPAMQATFIIPGVNSYLRTYRLGRCTITVTKEYNQWHMSIARDDRLPDWNEVAEARYRVIPDAVTMAMLLPPKADYVNLHTFCFQLVQIDQARL